MPTSVDLVTDLPADFEVFGQAVDTRLKALQPGTTLGDLAYSSATANTNTRLGIGTNGQALVVSGGVPAWGSPTVAPSFSLLNSGGTSLTGATVTISGISGMSTLWVNITGASLDAASNQIYVRFNGVTSGSLYDISGMKNQAPAAYSTAVVGATTSGTGGGDEWPIASMSSNAASNISGGLMVYGCNSSGTKVGHYITGSSAAGGNTAVSFGLVASFRSSSTISSISFTASAGNFDAGTVYVYGSA